MSLEEILDDIGGFGWFQIILIAVTGILLASNAWSSLMMSFAGYNPDWHCETRADGFYDNITIPRSNDTIKDCKVNNTWTNFQEMNCHDFTFDGSSRTIITEWDLLCDRKWIASIMISIQMGGVMLGSFLAGDLTDRIGRSKSLYGFNLLQGLVNIITTFSVSWQMFAVCRFFIGVGTGGAFLVFPTYLMEFMPMKWRPITSALPTWVVGIGVFSTFSYFLDEWSRVHLACGLFGLVSSIGYFILPESIRWLTVKGRLEEAEAVCEKVAKYNKRKVPSSVKSAIKQVYEEEQESRLDGKKYTYLDVLRGRRMLKITSIFCFFWFSMSLIYYGLSFGVSRFAGNLYLNIFLLSVVDMPANFFTFFILNRFGRKWAAEIFLGIGLIGALSYLLAHFFAPSGIKDDITVGFSFLTKMGIGPAWNIIITWGLELYPTVTRGLGLGIANMAARIGGIISPFAINFDDRIALSYFIICGLNFVCMVLTLFLDDTKGKMMPESLSSQTKSPSNQQKISKAKDVFTVELNTYENTENS